MSEPVVSVVIPAYGHADYIGDAIRSVLDQTTNAAIEIIVINDGSPDNTAAAVQPFVKAGQIRYFEQHNSGQATARNRGIAESYGEFLQLLDDDDVLTPGKIERQLQLFAQHADAVCVYGAYQRVDANLQPLPDQTKHEMPSGNVYNAMREACKMLSPGQALFRRSAIEQVGGLDETVWGSDDWDLYIRLAKLGPFVFDGEVGLHYRWHGGNASGSAVRHARNHLKVVRRHLWPNLALVLKHQKRAADYFVPNLQQFVDDRRREREFGSAAKALWYQLRFRPSKLVSLDWWKDVARCALRRPG